MKTRARQQTELAGKNATQKRLRAGLGRLRTRIDRLDEQLVRLLNRRASCALEIGHIKEVLGVEIYQPQRELEVLDHVRRANNGPLDDEALARLFERIVDEARRLERMAHEREQL